MIRTTVPTSVRKGSALLGIAGMLVLAGCSGAADTGDSSNGTDEAAGTGSASAPSGATGGDYADGTYTADGSYQTPETVEQISVTLTLADGVVTDVEVTGDPQAPETEQYQGQFIDGIAAEVEGVALDDLNVSRVAGSSLTSGGFNDAVESIKEQAAA
ncbi:MULTISPECIES: FMN-binding protein [unclassified Microbacterium]|uniref:FMN-binding protein n=1 Tax=unclassified Microbacterium TaxID=2609290 RepID=UPI00160511C8|nr:MULTISPECIES: FMN-binding protein [unclassified Microbacterium]QNA93110.1 FMN-binding protein [Microbacterium sp. Se63.02b]QYM63294.1 FMN-binding protein [Microbacterium sp. Se5.02b]